MLDNIENPITVDEPTMAAEVIQFLNSLETEEEENETLETLDFS